MHGDDEEMKKMKGASRVTICYIVFLLIVGLHSANSSATSSANSSTTSSGPSSANSSTPSSTHSSAPSSANSSVNSSASSSANSFAYSSAPSSANSSADSSAPSSANSSAPSSAYSSAPSSANSSATNSSSRRLFDVDIKPCIKRPAETLEFYDFGDKVEICCLFLTKPCRGSLTIFKDNSYLMDGVDKCCIKYTISNMTVKDEGRYQCNSIDNSDVYYVIILKEPPPPRIVKIVVSLIPRSRHVQFSVRFDPGEKLHSIDNYTVLEETKDGRRIHKCNNESILTGRTYECKFREPKITDLDIGMTLVVVRNRERFASESKLNFHPHKFVRPNAAVNLMATNTTASSATLSWCNSPEIWIMLRHMALRNAPVMFQMKMRKMQGVVTERIIDRLLSVEPWEVHDSCFWLQIGNLTAHTLYNVSVMAKTDFNEGPEVSMTFKTREAGPMSPPKEFLFWASHSHGNESNVGKSSALVITWRPPPHDQQGGVLSYQVHIFSDGVLSQRHLDVKTPYIVLDQVPHFNWHLKARVWAKTKVSLSANFTEVTLTPEEMHDIPELESHIELQKDRARTYVKAPFLDWHMSGVQWCRGRQHPFHQNLVICDTFPEVANFSSELHLTTETLKSTVVMSQPQTECQEGVSSEWEEGATVWISLRNRRHRAHTMDTTRVKVKRGKARCNRGVFNEMDPRPIKLFMSFTTGSKQTLRIFPFNCYYDYTKDEVHLQFKETAPNGQITLAWEQKCDHANPKQYLVDNFYVSQSEARRCEPVIGRVETLRHDVFSETRLPLARQHIYVCVNSLSEARQSNVVAHDTHYVGKEPGDDRVNLAVLGKALGGGIVSIIIVTLIGRWLCYNYKKRCGARNEDLGKRLTRYSRPEPQKNDNDSSKLMTTSMTDNPVCQDRDSGVAHTDTRSNSLMDSKKFSDKMRVDSSNPDGVHGKRIIEVNGYVVTDPVPEFTSHNEEQKEVENFEGGIEKIETNVKAEEGVREGIGERINRYSEGEGISDAEERGRERDKGDVKEDESGGGFKIIERDSGDVEEDEGSGDDSEGREMSDDGEEQMQLLMKWAPRSR